MIDTKTGRISRGPGEPPRFMFKDQPVPHKHVLRAAWLQQQTGYECDPRTVFLTERLRSDWFRERPAAFKAHDSYSKRRAVQGPMEMRTSERNTFATCHYQWWWRYVEWLTPKRPATPLWFGSAVHVALADYYLPGLARGPHPAETFARVLDGDRKTWVVGEQGEEDELTFTDARALGIDMLNRYVEHYGADPRYYVLATEQTFELQFKRDGKVFLRYHLTMDGLIRDMETGQIKILEHKTARDFGLLKRLRLDNQAGSYYAAAPHVLPLADLIKPGERVSGIEYNVLRKALGDDRPRNSAGAYTNKPEKKHYLEALATVGINPSASTKLDVLEEAARHEGLTVLGDVSKSQPSPYFHREPVFRTPDEQTQQLQRIQDEAKYMEGMRSGDPAYPILKTPGDHCAWCPFKQMCELHESGDDDAVESFKSAIMQVEDPHLAYHGKAA